MNYKKSDNNTGNHLWAKYIYTTQTQITILPRAVNLHKGKTKQEKGKKKDILSFTHGKKTSNYNWKGYSLKWLNSLNLFLESKHRITLLFFS